jgi:hypothetical protein
MLDFDTFGERIGLEQRYADDERFRVRKSKSERP